jgi:D-sedoheptulose 7-phosphate isomerase
VLAAAYRDRRRIFTLGNGGSAATASHMACDLGNNVVAANRPRLDITSLSENAATLTALANDRGYAAVFADQLTGISCPGDVLIAISGSGNSRNVVETLSAGRAAGLTTIALLGRGGGRARLLADVDISVADDDYGVIEDAHLAISHALVQELHARLAEDSSA